MNTVDVLAVMDNEVMAMRTRAAGAKLLEVKQAVDRQAAALEEARAAVAELIEAAEKFSQPMAEDSSYRHDLLSGIRPLERDSFMEQLSSIRSAIARCKGNAP